MWVEPELREVIGIERFMDISEQILLINVSQRRRNTGSSLLVQTMMNDVVDRILEKLVGTVDQNLYIL